MTARYTTQGETVRFAAAHHPRHREPSQHLESSLEARHQSANKQSIHEPEALMRNLQSSSLPSPSLLQDSRGRPLEQHHREQREVPGPPSSPPLLSAISTGAKDGYITQLAPSCNVSSPMSPPCLTSAGGPAVCLVINITSSLCHINTARGMSTSLHGSVHHP